MHEETTSCKEGIVACNTFYGKSRATRVRKTKVYLIFKLYVLTWRYILNNHVH